MDRRRPSMKVNVVLIACQLLLCRLVASQSKCPPVTSERPEPRTEDNNGLRWLQEHASLVTQMAINDTLLGGFQVIFYGDDIVENFLTETSNMGWAGSSPTAGRGLGKSSFVNHFASKFHTGVFAISGDQAVNVWWRFKNGEAPVFHKPEVAVVLVGGNDLSAIACNGATPDRLLASVPGVAYKIKAMISDMRKAMPNTQFIVAAQLPRGSGINDPLLRYAWPNQYTLPILALNADIQQFTSPEPWLHYVDCSTQFLVLVAGIGGIRSELMPDAMYPSAAGMEKLASCLAPVIEKVLAGGRAQINASPVPAKAPAPMPGLESHRHRRTRTVPGKAVEMEGAPSLDIAMGEIAPEETKGE